uniref:Tick transposon n=1 Tax=Caenorhabditis tropicalis TaxID=1561998 RepID=A0A1I7UBK3_9PELO
MLGVGARRTMQELQDHIAEKNAELAEIKAEKLTILRKIEIKDEEIISIKETIIMERNKVQKLTTDLIVAEGRINEQGHSSEIIGSELSNIRRRNSGLQSDNDCLRREILEIQQKKSEDIYDAVLAQKQYSDYQEKKKMKKLREQVAECQILSPSRGGKWKKYADLKKQDSINDRCRKMLNYMKKEIGDESFDKFVTDLCHFVSKNDGYSFKTKLSEQDTFYGCVKFKWGDSVVKDMKSFFRQRFGFDVFPSRKKIEELRNSQSERDSYQITVRSITKTIGTREVLAETANIQAIDVEGLVVRRLERLHQSGMLKMENENSPVVLGIGGDKGADHTKLAIVFGNVETPNNPHSILLVGMYEGNDDYDSLKQNFSEVLPRINSLKSVTYKEGDNIVTRQVQKLPIGDCKWSSAVLGHRGQSASAPCFMCKRTWTSHGRDAARLGCFDCFEKGLPYTPGDLKEPLLEFDHESIGPPSLHVLLGIVQSYIFNWLLALCNKIDFIDELPEDLKEQQKMLRKLQNQQEYYDSKLEGVVSSHDTIQKIIKAVSQYARSGKTNYSHTAPCGAKCVPLLRHLKTVSHIPKCSTAILVAILYIMFVPSFLMRMMSRSALTAQSQG